jgi:hypothetical protein
VATAFGLGDLILGLLLGRPGVMAGGLVAGTGGLWLAWEARRQGPDRRQVVLARTTVFTVVASAVVSAFRPEVAAAAALATLLPIIVAAPYVGPNRLRSMMIFVGAGGTLCAIFAQPALARDHAAISLVLSLPGFIASYLVTLVVPSGVANQLKGTTCAPSA